MTIYGLAGHQNLSVETARMVYAELCRIFSEADDPLVGVSNLAAGADQLFAELIVQMGGELQVVQPCRDYIDSFQDRAARDTYSRLREQASRLDVLPYVAPSEEAFFAGGRAMVDRAEVVIAVWDGQPSGGLGGTADVVAYARSAATKPHVLVLWPSGATRSPS